jgi:D-lyxose ketol-isomerase
MKLAIAKKKQKAALSILQKAGIAVTTAEKQQIEVADFGLNDIENIGLELVMYENNDRYCAKELVLLPGQICPEHRHPALSVQNPGKRETFRCRRGIVYLYVPGLPAARPKAKVPKQYKPYMTVWHEIVLRPGDQYTLQPNTLHWFQAGRDGAIVSEFSSTSDDASDIFTDPNIQRLPVIE